MKVSVVLNARSGGYKSENIVELIREYFFRCRISFFTTGSLEEFLRDETHGGSDVFLIIGGDGTVNYCLQHIMRLQEEVGIPPLYILPLGTANDLAQEINTSASIERAFDTIFEYKIQKIDILKVTSGDQVSFMSTNGGIGIAALTARYSNELRQYIYNLGNKFLIYLIKKIGAFVYTISFLKAIFKLISTNKYSMSIRVDGKEHIVSRSQLIFINNQSVIAKELFIAPVTFNCDGFFNLTIFNIHSIPKIIYLKWLLKKSRNKFEDRVTYEAKEVEINGMNNSTFDFFGDGEILFSNIEKCKIECLHASLPILVN